MQAPGLLNNVNLLNYLSPKALALVYLGALFAPVDTKKPAQSIKNWLASAPNEVSKPFRSAIQEIQTAPEPLLRDFIDHPGSKDVVTDVLGALLLREESQDSAKRRGAVFTPAWLARRVTRTAYKHWIRLHRSGKPPRTVADVACGPGAFLLASNEFFDKRETRIWGIDNNLSSIEYARLLAFASSANWELRCEDTLLKPSMALPLFSFQKPVEDDQFDILVGNPPFVRSQLLPPSYAANIRSLYPTTKKGNFDLSVAFIEHGARTLSEGGIAAYILTNKFMTSAYGENICRKLAKEVRILSLDDFQDRQIFHGYTTYTCVLSFAKKLPSKRFLITRFPNGVKGENDQTSGKTISLSTERLDHHPWDFASSHIGDILQKLRDKRHPLIGEVFGNILQGLRTGANHVFVIEAANNQNIESGILLPFINGEHIRRCRVQPDRLRLIYPYKLNEFGELKLLSESDFQLNFPKCWAYLLEHKSILQDRSIDRHSPWYAYSRSQNLILPRLKKLLVREMMPSAEFAADIAGELAFASGYGFDASRMRDAELKMWTAVLSTAPMEFALRYNGTQLQNGWFRLLKHHLRRVRLPFFSKDRQAFALNLAGRIWSNPEDSESLETLGHIVSQAFDLSQKDQEIIKDFLVDCHERSLGKSESARNKLHVPFHQYDDKDVYEPIRLDEYKKFHRERADLQRSVTFVPNKTLPVHRWFKYSQGFSADIVEFLLNDLSVSDSSTVLDPFAGCGTTNVVCQQKGIKSVGIDISPLMVWITREKLHAWKPNELEEFLKHIVLPPPAKCGVKSYASSPFTEYLNNAFSVGILNQLWTFCHIFDNEAYPLHHKSFLKLGLLSIMEDVSQIRKHGSHYRFMLKSDSIGLQKLNTPIISPDADIRPILMGRLQMMATDIHVVKYRKNTRSDIILGDSKCIPLKAGSITTVITSPPYLNRNNYIAQQKGEIALLSLVSTKDEYMRLVRRTFRSHVEAHFSPGTPHSEFSEIQKIIAGVQISLNNNPKIRHMIAGYFDDLYGTLKELRRVTQPGGKIAFIVGNSRWGGVIVPVDHLLCMLGEKIGLVVDKIYVTRYKGNSPQQMRKYGRIPVRESIVVLRKE